MATVGDFELLTGSSTPLLAAGDVVRFVDVSDSTQAPQGSLVRATLTQYFAAIPVPIVITSASATAFAVGLAGATNSAFLVDASTALQVAGLKVTGAVTGGTVAVVTTDSGAATNLTINAKGTGTIGIGTVSTGLITLGANVTVTAGKTLTLTTVTVTGLTAASVATGTFPGVYTVTGALTLSAALTYGGVTLSNAVTGTGNMVLSASPTFTGTAAFAGATFTTTVISTTAQATPIALSATQFTAFASTVNGAALMGFGTTYDVSLVNRAGNTAFGVLSNSPDVEFLSTLRSTSGIVTPSAFVATRMETFASAVSGAALMGFGTTNDVALMNRAGTVVLGIGPNTTTVNMVGAATVAGLLSANAGLTVASGQTLTVTGATITGLTAASVGAGTFGTGSFTMNGLLTVSGAACGYRFDDRTTGTDHWFWFADSGVANLGTGVANIIAVTRSSNLVTFAGAIKTAAVGGGGNGAWKLGVGVVSGGLVLNTSTYVSVTIDGSDFKLALVN